ncbi:hypothetical protein [Lutispora sp.]|uniref:hypothetical protein n=1 Tax=Lutispora sp. TaxID=2828727 RepID=UPI00356772A2
MLEKSKMNLEAGLWAKEKGYYDIAVSRYYYSLFQKVITILKHDGFYNAPKGENNTHNQVINDFNEYIYKINLAPEQIPKVTTMHKLKKKRNKADYSEEKIEYTLDFINDFLPKYNQFIKVIDSILIKRGIDNNGR